MAIAVIAAACADSPNAPRQAVQNVSLHPLVSSSSSNGKGRENIDNNNHTTSFVVDPSVAATYQFGNHWVYFPAQSICDPATSGYDETLWDAPCTPLSTPITITASWSNKHGHAFVDFEPALRFVPTTDPSQYVTLTLKDTPTVLADGAYMILWLRPSDGMWINEGAKDATEKETWSTTGNTISRRIKHFSGYNITSGTYDDCDPLLNPDWCLSTSFIQ